MTKKQVPDRQGNLFNRRFGTLNLLFQSLSQFHALRAFQYADFRRVWGACVLISFGESMERLIVGWFVLDQTNSVLLTALSFALRNAPNLIFGPIGGAIADSFQRSRLLILTLSCKVMLLTSMGLLLLSGSGSVWLILMLVLLVGIAFTFEVPATQALITDVVSSDDAMNGIALYSVGTRAIGVAGAVVGGLLIEQIGVDIAFLSAAAMVGLGMSAMSTVRTQQVLVPSPLKSIVFTAVDGLQSIIRLLIIRTLIALAIATQIFAFSFQALLPSVARDVLRVGPTGLGTLSFAVGIGSLVGSIALSLLGRFHHRGTLLLFVTIAYGGFLIIFALSTVFPVSAVLMVGVGAMASLFDALQWIMLQQHVSDEMRGRVIGGWVFATGFGWLGHLILGVSAEFLGVQSVMMISGAIVALLGIGLLKVSPRLRHA